MDFGAALKAMVDKMFAVHSSSLIYRRDCRACKHYKRMTCPNSRFCYNTLDKPFFEVR